MPSPRSRPRSARQSGCSVIRCWKTASIPSPARSLQSRSCFARFIAGRPELAHVRTRRHSPETNDVVERFNESIKYEHLFRLEIPDAITLADEAEAFRRLYNEIHPHESLDFATPLSRYVADPNAPNLFKPESVQDS
jgi:hypothetical protein